MAAAISQKWVQSIQGPDYVDDSGSGEQIEGLPSTWLQRIGQFCGSIHCWCRCVHPEVERMAAAVSEHVLVRFKKSLATDKSWQGIVALSNCDDQGQEVLSYKIGIWLKCNTSHYEGYHQLGHVSECVNRKCHISLHRWHFCQWSLGFYDTGEGSSIQLKLIYKDPERLEDRAKVLDLHVWGGVGENGTLWLKQGSHVLDLPKVITHQGMFSVCGQLVRHFSQAS